MEILLQAYYTYLDVVGDLLAPVWNAEVDAITNGLHAVGSHDTANWYDNNRWWNN